ncbi:GTP 3',8-cyclase [bioreactor metagenome]|uniref:GTP 3',8-cyclase n=1 Tax=bioreactor metagenome TaxID=1076179 RepID=A0A644Y1U0_9ZZZZ
MTDRFGRTIDYLRISITDRCNLRCVYCMPEDGVAQIAHGQVLTYEEILRLCRIMAGLGVKRLRVSGGEPLVRKGAAEFIARAKKLPGIERVTLTTNGVLLARELPALLEAGIDGINISLDTLSAQRYASITRRDELSGALAGIDAAYSAGVRPLKINSVLMRGINDDEILPLACLARSRDLSVRFIELMPMGPGKEYAPVSGREVLEKLTEEFGIPRRSEEKPGGGPAGYFSFPGFRGKIGLIDAVSHAFCGHCNRVRLTSDGHLKPCLYYDTGCDLRTPLRSGCGDEALRKLIQETVMEKPAGHRFGDSAAEHTETKTMNEIGG